MNESPGLTSAEDARNVGTLAFSVVVGVLLLVVAGRGEPAPASPREAEQPVR